nr:immunoglobulin light chain junction region [Macaca mulatta]
EYYCCSYTGSYNFG